MQTTSTAKQTQIFNESVYALIVTDSPLTEKYITAILREIIDLGNVHFVANCKDAISYIQSRATEHCSFIFYENCDEPNSHQAFIESLRQEQNTLNTPIVVLGHEVSEGYDVENARMQLTNFLQRPFVPSRLITLLFELFQEKDRRLAKRIDTSELPCTVDMGYYATQPYVAQMLNISYTGCLVQTQHDFNDCGNLDDIGSITFNTREGIKIHLSGKIVRVDQGDPHRIGFQFQNNDEEDLVKLGKLISALGRKD